MTTDVPLDRPLDRRFLIRGGAVLAGAAGATALGAALVPTRAEAADGANVVLGAEDNASETPTVITIDGAAGGADPTLVLNNANGPSLALQPLPESFEADLEVGQIANTAAGPYIGVNYGDGPGTTFLATGADLANTYPVKPFRALDTRSADGRSGIVDSSIAPFGAGGLKAGAYVDVALFSTAAVALVGVFVNITALAPTASGFVQVYKPGPRQTLPTARYERGVDTINSAIVEPGVVDDSYAVRVYTSQPTQVLLEVTGMVMTFPPTGAAAPASVPNRRLARQAKQRERLVRSIQNR